jgi:hypothetical protein
MLADIASPHANLPVPNFNLQGSATEFKRLIQSLRPFTSLPVRRPISFNYTGYFTSAFIFFLMGEFSPHNLDDFDPQLSAGYYEMAVSHFKPQPNVNQSCEVKSSVISY